MKKIVNGISYEKDNEKVVYSVAYLNDGCVKSLLHKQIGGAI